MNKTDKSTQESLHACSQGSVVNVYSRRPGWQHSSSVTAHYAVPCWALLCWCAVLRCSCSSPSLECFSAAGWEGEACGGPAAATGCCCALTVLQPAYTMHTGGQSRGSSILSHTAPSSSVLLSANSSSVKLVPWQAVPPPPPPAVCLCVPCMCSWTLALGEWIIKRLPLVKHIYSASKQVRAWLQHS